MKKLVWLIMACILLTGCAGTPDTDASSSAPQTDTSAAVSGTAFISEEKALSIASKHWNIQPGDRDPNTGYMMSLLVAETPSAASPWYHVTLQWLVGDAHFSKLDDVWIDAVTGAVSLEPK